MTQLEDIKELISSCGGIMEKTLSSVRNFVFGQYLEARDSFNNECQKMLNLFKEINGGTLEGFALRILTPEEKERILVQNTSVSFACGQLEAIKKIAIKNNFFLV